jgi:hypothetical protein
MNLLELKLQLVKMNVPDSTYCLAGGLPNEANCIEFLVDKWRVYYSERGGRTGLKTFDTESEACLYFLKEIESDSTITEMRKR